MTSGDPCPKCETGRMLTDCTRQIKKGTAAIRYLQCRRPDGSTCGARGKQRISRIPPRAARRERITFLVQRSEPFGRKRRNRDKSRGTIESMNSVHLVNEGSMPDLLPIEQVAIFCGTTWSTVRDWFDWGVLPAPLLIGGFARWRRVDLESWLKAGCPQTSSPSEDFSDQVAQALLLEFQVAAGKEQR